MKKVLTLAAALLVFGASASSAAGLNLYWNNCFSSGVAQTNLATNCATNTGLMTMVCMTYPPAMPMFAATNTVVDFQVSDPALPVYWQTLSGQCRQNAIAISYDVNNNLTACADLWQGAVNIQVSQVQNGVNGPNRVRIIGVAAVPAGSELNVTDTVNEQWVCRVTVSRSNTLACNTGCSLPVTIVLNEMYMQQPGGLPAYHVTNPAENACIGLNGGGSLCASGATPTQNTTWGAVKGLYR